MSLSQLRGIWTFTEGEAPISKCIMQRPKSQSHPMPVHCTVWFSFLENQASVKFYDIWIFDRAIAVIKDYSDIFKAALGPLACPSRSAWPKKCLNLTLNNKHVQN